jgi:hypothetical protein
VGGTVARESSHRGQQALEASANLQDLSQFCGELGRIRQKRIRVDRNATLRRLQALEKGYHQALVACSVRVHRDPRRRLHEEIDTAADER